MVIHKHILSPGGCDVNLPVSGYEVLSVANNNGDIVVYVKVNSNNEDGYGQTVPVKFYVHGTGHTLSPRCGKFLGTIMVHDIVLHSNSRVQRVELFFHVFCERGKEMMPA